MVRDFLSSKSSCTIRAAAQCPLLLSSRKHWGIAIASTLPTHRMGKQQLCHKGQCSLGREQQKKVHPGGGILARVPGAGTGCCL